MDCFGRVADATVMSPGGSDGTHGLTSVPVDLQVGVRPLTRRIGRCQPDEVDRELSVMILPCKCEGWAAAVVWQLPNFLWSPQ
jgi:hypothetical protein